MCPTWKLIFDCACGHCPASGQPPTMTPPVLQAQQPQTVILVADKPFLLRDHPASIAASFNGGALGRALTG
jgi:hypothetical protein